MIKTTKYSVGQVLYVVLKKETRIYPMMVSEELTRKTIEGETITYMVRGGTDPQSQLLITDVDGEIFDSAEKARSVLTERATTSIIKLVENAVLKAKEWYNVIPEQHVDPMSMIKKSDNSSEDFAEQFGIDAQVIELPDGKFAKVRSVKVSQPK